MHLKNITKVITSWTSNSELLSILIDNKIKCKLSIIWELEKSYYSFIWLYWESNVYLMLAPNDPSIRWVYVS
jgi:hypothetical protein